MAVVGQPMVSFTSDPLTRWFKLRFMTTFNAGVARFLLVVHPA
jgi:hypothetical protein